MEPMRGDAAASPTDEARKPRREPANDAIEPNFRMRETKVLFCVYVKAAKRPTQGARFNESSVVIQNPASESCSSVDSAIYDGPPHYPNSYFAAMGMRRPLPKARAESLMPGGIWRRLYSLRSSRRATQRTVSAGY